MVSGGFEQCSPGYCVDRDGFPYLTLEYVLSGKGSLRLNNRRERIEPGLVFTYGPDTKHTITADPGDPPRKYFLDFVGSEAEMAMQDCNLSPGSVLHVREMAPIKQVLDNIVEDGLSGRPFAADLCGALLEYLLLRLTTAATPPRSSVSPTYQTYTRCRAYIEQHFLRLHTLRQLSEELGVDQAHVCRLFKRYDVQTPYQMLTRAKMNEAARLLREDDAMVKDAAAAVGYPDPGHFSRVFKNLYGVAPQKYQLHRS